MLDAARHDAQKVKVRLLQERRSADLSTERTLSVTGNACDGLLASNFGRCSTLILLWRIAHKMGSLPSFQTKSSRLCKRQHFLVRKHSNTDCDTCNWPSPLAMAIRAFCLRWPCWQCWHKGRVQHQCLMKCRCNGINMKCMKHLGLQANAAEQEPEDGSDLHAKIWHSRHLPSRINVS